MKPLLSALAGAATWSLAEYGIHRHLGHDPKLHPNPFSKEHRRHHATTDYFAPSYLKLVAAAGAMAVVAPAAATLLGARAGAAFGFGFASAYLSYEVLHRLAHVRGPRSGYGRWLRRHHFHHHFHNPKSNHGVTSPLWDHVFGTYEQPQVVRVPERHAMSWLVGEGGAEVRPQYASDYEIKRAPRRGAGSRADAAGAAVSPQAQPN